MGPGEGPVPGRLRARRCARSPWAASSQECHGFETEAARNRWVGRGRALEARWTGLAPNHREEAPQEAGRVRCQRPRTPAHVTAVLGRETPSRSSRRRGRPGDDGILLVQTKMLLEREKKTSASCGLQEPPSDRGARRAGGRCGRYALNRCASCGLKAPQSRTRAGVSGERTRPETAALQVESLRCWFPGVVPHSLFGGCGGLIFPYSSCIKISQRTRRPFFVVVVLERRSREGARVALALNL